MFDLQVAKSKTTGNIRTLNSRLLEVSRKLEQKLRGHGLVKYPNGKLIHALFRKAVRTVQGIEALKKEHLIEEAWILTRVLLETHVNFFHFIRNDPAEMTRRYMDAAILEKLKHLREVDFYKGTPMESEIRNTDYVQAEADIKKRYSKPDFDALKRHGFSGQPFEARARSVGLVSMYTYCYRIASRSIHTFDPAETLLHEDYLPKKMRQNLLKSRRMTLESFQNMLLGRFAYMIDTVIDHPFEAQLLILGIGYEKFRDQNEIEVRSDELFSGESEEGDAIYIWRE